MSASLLPTCRELYENVASEGVALDWPYSKRRLSDAITYSIKTEGKLLYNKRKEKQGKGEFQYLRVTVGSGCGSSLGVPYVLRDLARRKPESNPQPWQCLRGDKGSVRRFTIYNKTWDEELTRRTADEFQCTARRCNLPTCSKRKS